MQIPKVLHMKRINYQVDFMSVARMLSKHTINATNRPKFKTDLENICGKVKYSFVTESLNQSHMEEVSQSQTAVALSHKT